MTAPHFDILLVEDSPTDAFLVEQALQDVPSISVKMACERRLDDALARLDHELFDLILLDLGLPDSAGFETFEAARSCCAELPIVVLTGSEDEALGLRLIHEGAQDYLVKGQLSGNSLMRSIRYAIERKRVQRALQEADRRKNEFLAMLAHELRNPLAPIAAAVEILRLGAAGEERVNAQETIARQVRYLGRLVDDLLDVTRWTQGKLRLRKSRTSVQKIVAGALELVQTWIEARDHRVVMQLPDEPLELEADDARMIQVVANLLHNAATYMAAGGRIELGARVEGSEIALWVRDEGPGIPAELLETLFDVFVQADRSLERSEGGLGIGLTLARAIVVQHGGRIEVRNRAAGGAEFSVRLPVKATLDEEPAAPPAKSVAPEADPPPLRVLLVEDNPDTAMMMRRLLEFRGYTIQVAMTGRQAVEIAPEFRPEVVLLDLGLPDLDGFEVARRLRAAPTTRDALIIAVTGYGSDEHRAHVVEAGFDHHLLKPVDWATLDSVMRNPRPRERS